MCQFKYKNSFFFSYVPLTSTSPHEQPFLLIYIVSNLQWVGGIKYLHNLFFSHSLLQKEFFLALESFFWALGCGGNTNSLGKLSTQSQHGCCFWNGKNSLLFIPKVVCIFFSLFHCKFC